MKTKLLFILLYSTFAFGQKPIELKIISLISYDEIPEERTFTLKFSISNNTDKTFHFILNPTNLIPISAGSMNPSIYYKVYEKENSIDVSGIFTRKMTNRTFKNQDEIKKFNDSIFTAIKNKTQEMIIEESKKATINNIQELKSGETLEFYSTLDWNKKRYFKNDVMEYYIDEKEPHFFELHMNLMKDELLSKFSESEKLEILKDKNFIKGWFTSNKVEINFKE